MVLMRAFLVRLDCRRRSGVGVGLVGWRGEVWILCRRFGVDGGIGRGAFGRLWCRGSRCVFLGGEMLPLGVLVGLLGGLVRARLLSGRVLVGGGVRFGL